VNRQNDRIWWTEQPHAQTGWLSKSRRFLWGVLRESARPICLHWINCDWRLICGHVGKLVVAQTEYQLWRLHSKTGQSSLPPIFTRMYECFSIVFFHSAGSDVLRMETTTFYLGHPVHRILHHVVSFFGGSLKTTCMCHHSPRPSRNFMNG
jgi:hypothetical protein